MATFTISVNDPEEISKLEAFVKKLHTANMHESQEQRRGLERIETIEAVKQRIQSSREMTKAGLFLTDEELDKEMQQWLGEGLNKK